MALVGGMLALLGVFVLVQGFNGNAGRLVTGQISVAAVGGS